MVLYGLPWPSHVLQCSLAIDAGVDVGVGGHVGVRVAVAVAVVGSVGVAVGGSVGVGVGFGMVLTFALKCSRCQARSNRVRPSGLVEHVGCLVIFQKVPRNCGVEPFYLTYSF